MQLSHTISLFVVAMVIKWVMTLTLRIDKIDTCCILVWRLALIEKGTDLLAPSQDNVSEWNIAGSHGAGSMISQWGSTKKSPRLCTVRSQYRW